MASIRKREWTTDKGEKKTAWLVDYRDSAGKRRAKQFARKKEAEAWNTQAAFQVSQGTHTADSASITVAKAVEIWLAAKRATGVEETTYQAYESLTRLHIVPLIGGERLNALTKPRIEQFKDELVRTKTKAQALRGLSHLRMIISEAERLGYVAQNVAHGVKLKQSSRHKKEMIIPTREEIRALMAAATPSERAMVMTLTMTGIRSSELRGMTWAQLDLKKAVLTINQRADRYNNVGSPKSQAGTRKIPLAKSLVAELREWQMRSEKNSLDLVFASPKGQIWTYSNLMNRVWWPLLVRAGVALPVIDKEKGEPIWDEETGETKMDAKYSLHVFRHAAASLWISQGIDIMRLKSWMGHAHVQTTLDTYGHLMHDHVADLELIERAEAALMA